MRTCAAEDWQAGCKRIRGERRVNVQIAEQDLPPTRHAEGRRTRSTRRFAAEYDLRRDGLAANFAGPLAFAEQAPGDLVGEPQYASCEDVSFASTLGVFLPLQWRSPTTPAVSP